MAEVEHASESTKRPDNDAPRTAPAPSEETAASETGAAGPGPGPGQAGAVAGPAPATEPTTDAGPRAADAPATSLGARAVKAKATVGAVADPAEREADRAADKVMRMAAPSQDRPTAVDPSVADASAAGSAKKPAVEPEKAAPPAAAPTTPASAAAPTSSAAPATAPSGPPAALPEPATTPPVRRAPAPTAGDGAGGSKGASAGPAGGAHDELGVPAETERYLDRSEGSGSPLPDATRKYFEQRFSADFRAVRVHDDDQSDHAARSIGALAFTRGNDIWFSAGAYDPVTDGGRRLIAHELAHVAQENPRIGRRVDDGTVSSAATGRSSRAPGPPVIRRVPRTPRGTETAYTSTAVPKGTIDTTRKTLRFETLPVPAWKAVAPFSTSPLTWRKPQEGRPSDQRSIWLTDSTLRTQSTAGVRRRIRSLRLGSAPYYLQGHAAGGRSNFPFIGSAEDIGSAVVIPPWEKSPNFGFRRFDVDHMKEWQLGGANTIDNMWLLDPSRNRSSGSRIMNNIKDQVDTFLRAANPTLASPPSRQELQRDFAVTFDRLTPEGGDAPAPNESWKRNDIGTDPHVSGLDRVPDHELANVKGTPDRLVIYQRAGGGQVKRIPLRGRTGDVSGWASRGYEITSATWELDGASTGSGRVGEIVGRAYKNHQLIEGADLRIPIMGMTGVDYGGFVDRDAVARAAQGIRAKFASPIAFPNLEFDFEKGLVGRGVIPTPSIKILENVQIAVVLDGGDVGVEASIAAAELKLPGPFKVTGGGMTLRATTGGLSVEGQIDFEIEGLATGNIHTAASTGPGGGFAVDGALDFESQMFTQAHLGLSYRDGHFGVRGTLAVGEGKIAGIKQGSVTVSVEDERVSATGSFTPSIRGLEHGQLGFRYDPATGSEITGTLQLSAGIPGIRGGTLEGKIAQKAGGEGYSLSGDITVQPGLPGVTAEIHGHYEDGAFLVEADVGYRRGMLDGSVHLGVTNQAPGADGRPAGPPTDHLTAFGGGQVTIRIAPWLQGRIGLQLQPNGEMIVTGEVSLPDHLDVFDEKRIEKNIFSIGIDIPIVGVAVAGQRIGIFATIRGGLDASAGIGPGQLRNLMLRVTYNPDREADTRIEGSAAFHVPAHAGLRLFVQGGLGAGIPVVSATAGLEVSGELGLEGAADASVNVAWTAATGLVLDARGEIFVEPKFRFAITGFVDVSADLLVHTIHLYDKRWELAAFEYGSNLRFGVAFPIHYQEGQPFNLSLDQVQFTYPTIDATELLSGLISHIA